MRGEEEMRRIMLILEPTDLRESSSESEHDDGDDDDDQEATRRLVVRTSGQLGHGLRPEQASFVLQTRGKLACTLYIHVYNSLYSTASEHDKCPILHHCRLCRMTQCSQSARTGSLAADDEFDSQRWNKDSCQSVIISVCVCVCIVRTYF